MSIVSMGRIMAAVDAWRRYGESVSVSKQEQENRYALLGAMYTGSWRYDPRFPWGGVTADITKNARQIVKHTGAIVDCYEQLVWQGDLSTDGNPLPDGSKDAI